MKCRECGSLMVKIGEFDKYNEDSEYVVDNYWICLNGCTITIERKTYTNLKSSDSKTVEVEHEV